MPTYDIDYLGEQLEWLRSFEPWETEGTPEHYAAGLANLVTSILAEQRQTYTAEETQDGALFCTGCASTTFRYEESVIATRTMASNGAGTLVFHGSSDEGDGDDDPGVVCDGCGAVIDTPDDWTVTWI